MRSHRIALPVLLIVSGVAFAQTVKEDDGPKYSLRFVRVTGFLDWHIAVYAKDKAKPSDGEQRIATSGYRIDKDSSIYWDQDGTRFGVWRDDWFLMGYDFSTGKSVGGESAYELKPPPSMERLSAAERAIKLMNQPDAASRGHGGNAMLRNSVERDHRDVAAALLDAKVDPDANASYPVLNIAASAGHLEMVRLLLERGAKVDGGSDLTPLVVATLEKRYEVMKELIKSGADVNKRVPLINAAAGGDERAVALLLDHGADINRKSNSSGKTPLEIAVWNKQDKVADLLRSRGAK